MNREQATALTAKIKQSIEDLEDSLTNWHERVNA